MASLTADMKVWLDKHAVTEVGFVGKLCGVFATEGYIHGGADLDMSTIIDHMLVFGGMVYSAGGSKGSPTIHLGPVALSPNVDDYKELCEIRQTFRGTGCSDLRKVNTSTAAYAAVLLCLSSTIT